MIKGYYYLHTNGELIYKPNADPADLRDSDFVKMLWPFDPENRAGAWLILVEALSLGADIRDLASKWGCDNEDAIEFAKHAGFKVYSKDNTWISTKIKPHGTAESVRGTGKTALESMAKLCTGIGYVPQKIWGRNFSDLVTL